MTIEYWVNRRKAYISRLLRFKENLFLKPRFHFIKCFDNNKNTLAQNHRSMFGNKIEFFLFNFSKPFSLKQFIEADVHERTHRIIGEECDKTHKYGTIKEEETVCSFCKVGMNCLDGDVRE